MFNVNWQLLIITLSSIPLILLAQSICKVGNVSDLDGWARCHCEYLITEKIGPMISRRRVGIMDEGELGGEMVRLNCDGMLWIKMANLSDIWTRSAEEDKKDNKGKIESPTHPSIGALSVRNSFVSGIGQDTFRAEPGIQFLDLAQNAIEAVNANAFRGLEGQLFHLDLSGNRLGQVPSWALTYLRNLQHLSLRDNRIAELRMDTFAEVHLRNLRYLHLDGNKIAVVESASLQFLPLHVLTMSNNRIIELQNRSLPTQLWFIDLKSNFLTKVPFAALEGLNALRTLDLERNNISELEGAQQGRLESELDLQLAHNRIQRLLEGSFDGFRRFNRVDLSHNQITSISEKAFRSVTSLVELDLGSNSILQIPQNAFLRFAHSLRKLNLEQNQLGELPHALRPMMALQQLNLNGNRIRTLDEKALARIKTKLVDLSLARNMLERIPSESLQGMITLRILDLSSNQINEIGKMAFGSFEGFSPSGVSSLQRLSLAGNQIKEIVNPGALIYLSQLVHFDLSHNRIYRLNKAALERLEALEWLSLDYNEMSEFPRNALSSLNRLRHLSMDANLLQLLPNYAFQWLIHLKWLSLARNRLHSINAKTFHSTSAIQIRWLNLGHNRISRMEKAAFQNLPNLERLFLSHNRLTSLQTQILSSLKSLRQLSLAHNRINETQESAFENLPQLEELSLAHNRLRTIKEGVFQRVPSLTRLDLSHNRIEAFDLDFLEASHVHQLRMLDLSSNVIRKLEIQSAKHSLRSLQMRNNQLELVHAQMLQGFEQLRSVDLSHNDLIDLNGGAFWGSRRLERIVLAENNIRTIWRDTFRDQILIQTLDLSGNVLHSLDPGVFGKGNMLELDLSRNNFSEIPSMALSSVRQSLSSLRMSNNGLRILRKTDFKGMNNLSVLDLGQNRIEILEEEMFSLLPKLRWLVLSGNPVSTWSPHTFMSLSPFLEHLDLSRAGLFSLPKLHKLSSLRHLNLSGNFLYELSPADVDSLPALRILDLARNRLVEIRAELFEKMPELRLLNLSENVELRSLHEEHLRGLSQLETLSIARMSALTQFPVPSAFAALFRLQNLEIHSISSLSSDNITQILQFLPPLRSLYFESTDETFSGRELVKVDIRLLRELSITGTRIKHRQLPSTDVSERLGKEWKMLDGWDNEHEEMKGIFMARGPAFKANHKSGQMEIIDIYQLILNLLGVEATHQSNGSWDRVSELLSEGWEERRYEPQSFALRQLSSISLITFLIIFSFIN